jgi:hypothetical protein
MSLRSKKGYSVYLCILIVRGWVCSKILNYPAIFFWISICSIRNLVHCLENSNCLVFYSWMRLVFWKAPFYIFPLLILIFLLVHPIIHVSWVNKVKFEWFNSAPLIELYHKNYDRGGSQSVGDSEFCDGYSTAFPFISISGKTSFACWFLPCMNWGVVTSGLSRKVSSGLRVFCSSYCF